MSFAGFSVKVPRSTGLAAVVYTAAASLGVLLAQPPAGPTEKAAASTPTTYCNPISLPNYPLGKLRAM